MIFFLSSKAFPAYLLTNVVKRFNTLRFFFNALVTGLTAVLGEAIFNNIFPT